jgi:nitrogen regulatory protein PII
MKMAVFWVVAWQKFTDVSEVLAAFIIRAMTSTRLHGATTQKTASHLHTRRSENLKSQLHLFQHSISLKFKQSKYLLGASTSFNYMETGSDISNVQKKNCGR